MTRLPSRVLGIALLVFAALLLAVAPQVSRPTPAAAQTVGTTLNVCGVLNAYSAATASTLGSIAIGGTTYPIATGTTLTGANYLITGTSICLVGTLNAAGALSSGGITAGASAKISVCGVISAYVPASATSIGSITIGGTVYPIAAGATFTGTNLLTVGTNACLSGAVNAAGQISGGTVTANATATVTVCGVVSAYTAASATAPGSIAIGASTYTIATGTALTGAGLLTAGANICLSGTLNGAGQISGGAVTASTSAATTVSVCGVVSAYTAATVSAAGSIAIGGVTYPIAAGTTLTGANLITVGSSFCLNGTLNGGGQLSGGAITASGGASTSVNVCGVVSAYTAATATVAGSIAIAGVTYTLPAGTVLNGGSQIAVGTALCLSGSLNGSGQLTTGTVTSLTVAQITICGTVSAYTATTTTAAGSIAIDGITFPIAIGVAVTGSPAVTAGASLGLALGVSTAGQVVNASVTASTCTTPTIGGVVGSFTSPTSTTAGSVTIAGITFTIAAGSTLSIATAPPLSASLFVPSGGRGGRILES